MLICILFLSSKFKLLKDRALVYFLFCLQFHYMAVIFLKLPILLKYVLVFITQNKFQLTYFYKGCHPS